MKLQDAVDAYKWALTEEYGYFTIGYHTYGAGQILEKMLDRKEWNQNVLSFVARNREMIENV